MNELSPPKVPASLTRRAFVGVFVAAGFAIAAAPHKAMLAEAAVLRPRAIVSFHMDRPYIDRSGTAVPYYPPLGARSGQIVAHLTEEDFRRICIYA